MNQPMNESTDGWIDGWFELWRHRNCLFILRISFGNKDFRIRMSFCHSRQQSQNEVRSKSELTDSFLPVRQVGRLEGDAGRRKKRAKRRQICTSLTYNNRTFRCAVSLKHARSLSLSLLVLLTGWTMISVFFCLHHWQRGNLFLNIIECLFACRCY
jgi:hypothetical protein